MFHFQEIFHKYVEKQKDRERERDRDKRRKEKKRVIERNARIWGRLFVASILTWIFIKCKVFEEKYFHRKYFENNNTHNISFNTNNNIHILFLESINIYICNIYIPEMPAYSFYSSNYKKFKMFAMSEVHIWNVYS